MPIARTRGRRVAKVAILICLGALIASVVVWPTVTYWRLRYWIEPSARRIALNGLMRVAPDGGDWELRHAAGSESDLLRRDAAGYMAQRGDRHGVRIIVELCFAYPNEHTKFSPQRMLRETVAGDAHLSEFEDADGWWAARADDLVYDRGGRWRLADRRR